MTTNPITDAKSAKMLILREQLRIANERYWFVHEQQMNLLANIEAMTNQIVPLILGETLADPVMENRLKSEGGGAATNPCRSIGPLMEVCVLPVGHEGMHANRTDEKACKWNGDYIHNPNAGVVPSFPKGRWT